MEEPEEGEDQKTKKKNSWDMRYGQYQSRRGEAGTGGGGQLPTVHRPVLGDILNLRLSQNWTESLGRVGSQTETEKEGGWVSGCGEKKKTSVSVEVVSRQRS